MCDFCTSTAYNGNETVRTRWPFLQIVRKIDGGRGAGVESLSRSAGPAMECCEELQLILRRAAEGEGEGEGEGKGKGES